MLISIKFKFLFCWGTFEFPFLGVHKDQADSLKEELESIVSHILEIPQKDLINDIIINDIKNNLNKKKKKKKRIITKTKTIYT